MSFVSFSGSLAGKSLQPIFERPVRGNPNGANERSELVLQAANATLKRSALGQWSLIENNGNWRGFRTLDGESSEKAKQEIFKLEKERQELFLNILKRSECVLKALNELNSENTITSLSPVLPVYRTPSPLSISMRRTPSPAESKSNS